MTTKPTPAMMGGMEASNAQTVLLAEPGAVAAYDLVPCKAASAVFTMDTSTDIFLLHTLQVQQVEEHVDASAYKELDRDNTTYVCTRCHYICCQHEVMRGRVFRWTQAKHKERGLEQIGIGGPLDLVNGGAMFALLGARSRLRRGKPRLQRAARTTGYFDL